MNDDARPITRADVERTLRRSRTVSELVSELLATYPDLELYLVGGAVRDLALARATAPPDFDFFVAGPLDPVLELLAVRGTVRATPFGSPRWFPAEGGEELHCDVIPIDRFSNGLWRCHNIEDALTQFDFTGNALAIDLRTGHFFDPVGGLRDLRHRRMRMIVEYPDEPIAPGVDLSRVAVLWFRILHYAALLDLTIEPGTRRWLRDHRACLKFAELFAELFFAPHPSTGRLFAECLHG